MYKDLNKVEVHNQSAVENPNLHFAIVMQFNP